MAILRKILVITSFSIIFMILLLESCFAASPLTMEIKQVEIAKDVRDEIKSGDNVLVYVSDIPRIRIWLEFKNNKADTMKFYGNGLADLFNASYMYKGKHYSQHLKIVRHQPIGQTSFKVSPGETFIVSVIFYPEVFKNDDHPHSSSSYSQFLWDILPSLTIAYECGTGWYAGEDKAITASWGDWDDIMIKKVQKGDRKIGYI